MPVNNEIYFLKCLLRVVSNYLMMFYWTVYSILTIFERKSNNNCKGIRKMLKNGFLSPVSEKRQRVTVWSEIENLVSRDGTIANVSSLVYAQRSRFASILTPAGTLYPENTHSSGNTLPMPTDIGFIRNVSLTTAFV